MKFLKGRDLAAYLLVIVLMTSLTGCVAKEVADQEKKTAVREATAAAAVQHQQDIKRVYATKDEELRQLRADVKRRDERLRQLESDRQRDLQKKYEEGVAAGEQIGNAKGFQAGQDSGQEVAQQVFDEKLKTVAAQHETEKKEMAALAKQREDDAIETAIGQAKLLWAGQSMVENNRFTLLVVLVSAAFTIVVSLLGSTSLFAYLNRGEAKRREEWKRNYRSEVAEQYRRADELEYRRKQERWDRQDKHTLWASNGYLEAQKRGVDPAPFAEKLRIINLGGGGVV